MLFWFKRMTFSLCVSENYDPIWLNIPYNDVCVLHKSISRVSVYISILFNHARLYRLRWFCVRLSFTTNSPLVRFSRVKKRLWRKMCPWNWEGVANKFYFADLTGGSHLMACCKSIWLKGRLSNSPHKKGGEVAG